MLFPLQINRGLDVDVYGANGAYLSMGSLKGSTYVDAIRMSGGLAANGTDGSYTLQTLGGGNYTTALSINSSQESTFAGNITMASGTALTGMNTLRLENGTNKRNLSCDGAGNLDISNAANNATIFHLQDSSLTLGTTLGTGSLQLYSGNINVGNRTALNNSFFGYSSSYRTLIVGTTGDDYQTNASSICFGVSLNGNSSPSFTGNGTEYFWRNAGSFKTPNSINNGYNTFITME